MPKPELEKARDADLLQSFVERRDQSAFAELVRRHGGMVIATIRRLVDQREDEEDAFQATFLALAKYAKRLLHSAAVAGWLHTTARRCALDVVRARIRWERTASFQPEENSPVMAHHDDPSNRISQDELTKLLDEELTSLPVKVKDALVLCDIEGLSHREAAKMLGISVATVGNLVKKGRELLRSRLARRGITLSVATIAAWSADCEAASGVLTDALIAKLTTNATLFATGGTAAEMGIPARVIHAASGVIWAGYTATLSVCLFVLLTTCAVVPCFATVFRSNAPNQATSLHYWRFEDAAGFLSDSIGTARLVATNFAIEPVTLQNQLRGGHFPTRLFRADLNSAAADCQQRRGFLSADNVTPIDSAFTIELFVHVDDLLAKGKNDLSILVAQAKDCTKPKLFSWAIGISKVQRSGGKPRELVPVVSDGNTFHSIGSGILIDIQQDYFVSASFDLGQDTRFYVKNLKTGELRTKHVTHKLRHLNVAGSVKLGGGPHDWAFYDGLIDEVRLSQGLVPVDSLLVNASAHVNRSGQR